MPQYPLDPNLAQVWGQQSPFPTSTPPVGGSPMGVGTDATPQTGSSDDNLLEMFQQAQQNINQRMRPVDDAVETLQHQILAKISQNFPGGKFQPQNPNIFLPNSGFFGQHPNLSRGIEQGMVAAGNTAPSQTPGQGIANVANALLGTPHAYQQLQFQRAMAPLGMQSQALQGAIQPQIDAAKLRDTLSQGTERQGAMLKDAAYYARQQTYDRSVDEREANSQRQYDKTMGAYNSEVGWLKDAKTGKPTYTVVRNSYGQQRIQDPRTGEEVPAALAKDLDFEPTSRMGMDAIKPTPPDKHRWTALPYPDKDGKPVFYDANSDDAPKAPILGQRPGTAGTGTKMDPGTKARIDELTKNINETMKANSINLITEQTRGGGPITAEVKALQQRRDNLTHGKPEYDSTPAPTSGSPMPNAPTASPISNWK